MVCAITFILMAHNGAKAVLGGGAPLLDWTYNIIKAQSEIALFYHYTVLSRVNGAAPAPCGKET
jgi:hypothetical protein